MIHNKYKIKSPTWLFALLVLMMCTTFANAQTTIRYQKEMQGGVTMVGNSWYYSAAATPTTRQTPNVDPVSNTMSTSADLILPAGSKIEKVFLAIEKNGAANFTSVKLKAPGSSTYTTLLAASSIADRVDTGYAQMIWDITALVSSNGYVSTSGGGIGGRFYLANPLPVPTSMGGWSVIVVYSNPNSKFRSITVADNWQYFFGSTANTNITGIRVPASGTVKAVVGVTGTYGDRGTTIAPDYLNFGKTSTTLTSLKDPMTGASNDALNSSIAWASTNNVTADGGPAISGNYTARNPISAGNFYTTNESWEFDADIFDASGILSASASPIDITLSQIGTGADQLASGSYFVSVDLAPPAKLTKTILPASIVDGGTATYTWTISNTGAGAVAQTISFTDTLPTKIKVASTPNITVTGGSASTVTAVAGSGSVQVSGLTLAAGASATVKVNITNVPGELNASCSANPAEFTNSIANITVPTGVLLDVSQLTPQCLVVTQVPCSAGTLAPTVDTSATNICPSTTVNLDTQAHTGTAPGNSSLVWFTNNAHTGTPYASPATATAGTYYAFYYGSANGGCYSSASSPVTVTINNCTPPTPDDAFAHGLSVQPGGVLSSCGTATVTGSFGFTGPIATGYNNANHWSEMAIMLPGFLYTRAPNDPGIRTEVNNETNFNLQMTVTSSDGVVYWDPPYVEADHSIKLVLKQDAIIPFGTVITWKVTGLEVDDAQNYSGTVGINIYHAAVDGDDTNNYMEIPVVTNNQCSSACYKPGISGTGLPTKHGISALGRAGVDQGDNWPMVREGAWTVLESKTKGFVINRIPTTSQVNAIPNSIEGMMVYDEEADCLKIYSSTNGVDFAWRCFTTQACPTN